MTITPNKLCHHIKSPVKLQQNKKINPISMHSQPPINSQTASSLQSDQNTNPYISQNLTFGDEILRKTLDSFCLILQNVGGLEFTLEEISGNMFRKEVDVACLNTNWKHSKSKYKATKILKQYLVQNKTNNIRNIYIMGYNI